MKRKFLNYLVVIILITSCSDENEPERSPSGEGIFNTEIENGVIEGELFLPEGNGPFPVLVIVPGSGNSTKEEAASFAPIINGFGYALYTYNKRGIGASTGTYPVETIENPTPFLQTRAEDVKSIISFLKTHADIKDDEISLFGSSQGTWVNCLVYNDLPSDLSQIIMISGGATSTGEEFYYEQLIEEQGMSIEDANDQVSQFDGNKGYDPLITLENATIPMLFIYGGLDDSHPTLYDRELIESINNPDYEIHFYPNANHELIDETTGSFPDGIFTEIETWLKDSAP